MKVKLKSFYASLTPEYLADRKSEIEEIQTKLSQNNLDFLVHKFHKIAGSGGSYGLEMVSTVASEIEAASQSRDIEKLVTLVENYCSVINSIEIEFE